MAKSQRQVFEKQRDTMRQEMEKKYTQDKEEKELVHKDLAFLDTLAPKTEEVDNHNQEDEI
jgi:hypothetical protein